MDLHKNINYIAGLTDLLKKTADSTIDFLDEGNGTIYLIQRASLQKKYQWDEASQTFIAKGKEVILDEQIK